MSKGYLRISQVKRASDHNRLIVLRKSLSIINQLNMTTENEAQINAYDHAIKMIDKEINELTSRLTVRS